MEESAKDYNLQGLKLTNNGKYADALDFFSKAIEVDPKFADAYKNRGEALILLDRFVEGNRDLQKAKGFDVQTRRAKKEKRVVKKYNMHEVDDLYSDVLSEDTFDIYDEPFDIEENLRDYVFSEDTLENEQVWEEIAQTPVEQPDRFSAILEYLGGIRQEVAKVQLFEPQEDTLSIFNEEDSEQVVWFSQLACIRTSDLPPAFSGNQDQSGTIEIIETVDGNIYYERVNPKQDNPTLLLCHSTKEHTAFSHTLFPISSIKKRRLEKQLVEILTEKRLISKNMLMKILEEYEHVRSMKLGKIIAQQTRIPTAKIEAELDNAQQGQIQGLKTGEILLASGLIDEGNILQAIEYQEHLRNLKIGQFLIEKGIVHEKEVYACLAEKHRIPFINLSNQKISKKTLKSLPKSMIINHEILPIAMKHNTLIIATHFVDMAHMRDIICQKSGCQHVKYVLAQPSHIRNMINVLYNQTH